MDWAYVFTNKNRQNVWLLVCFIQNQAYINDFLTPPTTNHHYYQWKYYNAYIVVLRKEKKRENDHLKFFFSKIQ